MNVLLVGAKGMVGQGVLRECLLVPGVTRVHAIGRTYGIAMAAADVPLSGTRDAFSRPAMRQTLTTAPSTENHAIDVIFPLGTYRKAGPEPETRDITTGT
jgi:hypothetical protein